MAKANFEQAGGEQVEQARENRIEPRQKTPTMTQLLLGTGQRVKECARKQ